MPATTATRNLKQLKAHEYLTRNEGKLIDLEGFSGFCGWKVQTAKTHISKKLKKWLTPEGNDSYRVTQGISKLSPEDFIKLMSQVDTIDEQISPESELLIEEFSPFSPSTISKLFLKELGSLNRLMSCESSHFEYKESFNWSNRAKYSKSMAAFANASGGYIVFGVNDNREMVGLRTSNFENTKIEDITNYLNNNFSPEIKWDKRLYTDSAGVKLGIIYVFEAPKKPVVSIGSNDGIKEAEIYYRYGGRSEKIKYPELLYLIESEQKKDRELWLSHLNTINKFGVENVGIFDSVSGEVKGSKGSFLISEQILPKLTFIREGKFQEKDGAPAIVVIGEARTIQEAGIRPIHHHNITALDILNSFFERTIVPCPLDYIKRVCSETTAYFPVYFFIKQAGLPKHEILNELDSLKLRNPSTKNKLINRLKADKNLQNNGSLNSQTMSAKQRKDFLLQIIAQALPDNIFQLQEKELQYFFQAITHTQKDAIDLDYLLPILKGIFDHLYLKVDASLAGDMRKAVCYIDNLFFSQDSDISNPTPS